MQHLSVVGGGSVILIIFIGIVLASPASALEIPAPDPERIEQTTYDLCTFERALGSEERVEAATYIAETMEEYGLSVGTERFAYTNCYFDPELSLSSNIIGVREGATDEIVVICAHYDTADPETPGADDNAAGVATMLEVARILEDITLNRTVYFIAFGGEETGLDGSRRWLADNPDLHDRIVFAISLDCVALGDRLHISVLPQHRWILNTLPSSTCLDEVTMHLPSAAAEGDEDSFRAAMIPALRIYEEESRQIMHTPDDRPECLNYTLAAECARIVAGTVVGSDVAAGDPAPGIDLRVEDGTIVFTRPEDTIVEVIVDGTSLGVLPSGSVTLPEGPHTVQAITYGPGGSRSVTTITGIGVETELPDASGNAVAIQWGGEREVIYATFASVQLSYHLENPDEVTQVDGYFDGILIQNLDNDHPVVPTSGPHTFIVVAYGSDGEVIGANQTAFTIQKFRIVDFDGGLLQVDETGGASCSASTRPTYSCAYSPDEDYRVVVGCEYVDTADAFLQTAAFWVGEREYHIYDIPFLDNSQRHEIALRLEPEGPGTYQWNISCSRGDKNAVGSGSVIFY